MNHAQHPSSMDYVTVVNPAGTSPVVLVCEHASRFIPGVYNDLGLTGDALHSHAAWDPGALAVAQYMSERLNAPLVASNVSRLVYDCNRPLAATDAIPDQSETITVPGNKGLTVAQRQDRATTFYEPFRKQLAKVIGAKAQPVIVTIHSFTPVYHGKRRQVEIGVLHDRDTRLADAMLQVAGQHRDALVLRNAPYGTDDGVTHTLKEHALPAGHLNVMLEIRNDLIQDTKTQSDMAEQIANWVSAALVQCQSGAVQEC